MIKLIIFDLDGTLLDTSRDIHATLNATLKKFGVPEIPLDKTLKFVGNGAGKLVERALGEKWVRLTDEVYRDYTQNFADCDNALTSLYEFENDALTSFVGAGIKLAVVTNKPQRAADKVCRQYLSDFSFEAIIGQSDGVALKPDPTATLGLIRKLGFKNSECLFVGDGETDIATARNAGIECVSALWGYRGGEELEAAGGKIFAKSFKELQNIVEKFT